MSLSKEQIATFAKYYPDNARPVQRLNGRTVQHSK
jgi:carbonic anhydrase